MTVTLVAADDIPVTPDDGLPPGQPYVSPDDLASIPPLFAEAAGQVLLPLVAEIWQQSAGVVHAQLVDAADLPNLPPVSSLAAETYLAQAANTFAQVGDDLWAVARSELLAGFEAGESIPQLADRLRGSAGLTARKATLVARTQVLDASNAGSYATAQASGIDLRKGWLDTPDNRTRETHRLAGAKYGADQQMIPMADQFVVGGYSCDRPHDPTLPPSERYSCRCTVIYSMGEQAVRDAQEAATPPAPLPNTSGQIEPPPLAAPVELPRVGGPETRLAGVEVQQASKITRLTETQRKALDRYGGDGSYVINADLRDRSGRIDLLTERNRQTVQELDSIFAQSELPGPAVLYRKIDLSRGPFGDLANADRDLTDFTWTENAYSSTSIAERLTGGRAVQVRVFVPKGTRAISHEVLDSDEVLLDRGTTFRVLTDRGKNDRFDRVLDVEVVLPPVVESPLAARTVVQLRALAKQQGIPGYSKLTKPQLLERLEAGPSLPAVVPRLAKTRPGATIGDVELGPTRLQEALGETPLIKRPVGQFVDRDYDGPDGAILARSEPLPAGFESELSAIRRGEFKIRPGLTADESRALDRYALSRVADPLNTGLRAGKTSDFGSARIVDQVVDLDDELRLLDTAIDAGALAKDTSLYRGALMRPADIGKLQPGAVTGENGFLSTTTDLENAFQIINWRKATAPAGRSKVVFQILAPKGTRAAAGHIGEREVLLARGRRLRVVEVSRPTRPGDVRRIVLEILPEPPPSAVLEGRALREAARERNRIIEARAVAEQTLAELDDLLVKKASREAFEQRIAAAQLDPKDLAALRAALGDPVKLRAQVTRITKKQGITVQAKTGAKVKFDPALHDPVGDVPAAGTPVVVIRRGTTLTVDGDTIVLNRAVVRLPVTPAKRAPAKAAKAAPKKAAVPEAPTPSDPRVAALPRTAGRPPTPAKAAKATNPKFGTTQQGPTYRDAGKAGRPYTPDMGPLPSGAFEENCTNVVQAFEMRMRGFDVDAAPLDVLDKYGYAAGRTFGEIDQLLTDVWRLPDGTPHGRSFAGQAWKSFTQIDEEIDATWPDGGRGFIFVGKHIFNVVKVRGKPVYYEAQFDANTTRNVTALYRRKYGGESGQAKLFRVDDLEPVGGILDTITPI